MKEINIEKNDNNNWDDKRHCQCICPMGVESATTNVSISSISPQCNCNQHNNSANVSGGTPPPPQCNCDQHNNSANVSGGTPPPPQCNCDQHNNSANVNGGTPTPPQCNCDQHNDAAITNEGIIPGSCYCFPTGWSAGVWEGNPKNPTNPP